MKQVLKYQNSLLVFQVEPPITGVSWLSCWFTILKFTNITTLRGWGRKGMDVRWIRLLSNCSEQQFKSVQLRWLALSHCQGIRKNFQLHYIIHNFRNFHLQKNHLARTPQTSPLHHCPWEWKKPHLDAYFATWVQGQHDDSFHLCDSVMHSLNDCYHQSTIPSCRGCGTQQHIQFLLKRVTCQLLSNKTHLLSFRKKKTKPN